MGGVGGGADCGSISSPFVTQIKWASQEYNKSKSRRHSRKINRRRELFPIAHWDLMEPCLLSIATARRV